MNSVSHIEINVFNLEISVDFWSKFLLQLGWQRFDLEFDTVVGFRAPDGTNIFLVQTEEKFLQDGYHRKHTGLNHLAFRVASPESVENIAQFLKNNKIKFLYHENPKDYSSEYSPERYYAIFFEDPDRIKIEVVYTK